MNLAFDKLGAIAEAVQGGCGDNHPTPSSVAGLAMPGILFEVEAVAAGP